MNKRRGGKLQYTVQKEIITQGKDGRLVIF